MKTLQDKIRGSLIGGGVGDALGYPVEFMSHNAITHKYGKRGYTRYEEFNSEGKAVISDDTQMTLFTANGLLFGVTRFCSHGMLGASLKDFVSYAYQDWLQTQNGVQSYNKYHYCWICDIQELNARRAPGNTCMSALLSIQLREKVENDSKGCGGVMRVAPVGLMAAADELTIVKDYYGNEVQRCEWAIDDIIRLGGDCAEITHKHPLGYLPAAFQAALIYRIITAKEEMSFSVLQKLIEGVYADIKRVYTSEREQREMEKLWALVGKAIQLAMPEGRHSEEIAAINILGEGWTGDEALAIAIYCTLRHLDSFEDAIVAAVNHDGDSDSTGAVCGNLMGAIVGYDAIPSHYTRDLELKELILEIADDIVQGCTINEDHSPDTEDERRWKTKYVKNDPYPRCPYRIVPTALRLMEARLLMGEMDNESDPDTQCRIGYDLALKIYDTASFDPYRPLRYRRQCDEPEYLHLRKELMPAFYWHDDPKYSLSQWMRSFRLNIGCFSGKSPIVAVRDDCNCQRMNILRAGLEEYNDSYTENVFRGWAFYRIDPSTADDGYAIFTNGLEKEFAVEIAHLWEDGTFHRIYHLFY